MPLKFGFVWDGLGSQWSTRAMTVPRSIALLQGGQQSKLPWKDLCESDEDICRWHQKIWQNGGEALWEQIKQAHSCSSLQLIEQF